VQNKLKCHPDILRQQLRIIQAVPNSIFLIKGGGDNENIRQLLDVIALEVGLETQQIQFLPSDPDELTHRANLAIADVVLDTYPYNGATTTLETLWMEIPLVTKVGEQFAARNSYDFLMQVGIQEGIAWSDQEYIDWGIRLGQDVALRAMIKSKLQIAKQYSPLWNAKKFTQVMEKAYQQMWQIYCESDLDLMPFKNP
jgi:predicted O-linked N-acetylglucosamine transferase (SPINDLY family)